MAHLGSPGKRAVKLTGVYVCVCVRACVRVLALNSLFKAWLYKLGEPAVERVWHAVC